MPLITGCNISPFLGNENKLKHLCRDFLNRIRGTTDARVEVAIKPFDPEKNGFHDTGPVIVAQPDEAKPAAKAVCSDSKPPDKDA